MTTQREIEMQDIIDDWDGDAAAELADERWHEQRMDRAIAADWNQQAQLRQAERDHFTPPR